jgi:uncharacterized iron-regulated membrane protein
MAEDSELTELLAGATPIARRLSTIRRWALVHKWSSLACTAFLLLICVTGLPLLFSDEINGWLEPHTYEALPAGTPKASLNRIIAAGRQLYPGEIVTSLFLDDDEPQIYLWMAPSWAALEADEKSEHFIRFDARTAKILERQKTGGNARLTFVGVMLSLHRDLFLDLPGELFLGAIALVFVAAVVSGVVLHGPFMRRLEFGTVRRDRSARIKWLDVHNLLGVATLGWVSVVGITGLMNELSTPLFGIWQLTEVRSMLAPWRGQAPPAPVSLVSVEAALQSAKRHLPGRTITSVVFPGSENGSPHHFVIWSKGDTPLASRLFNPSLVDALSGEFVSTLKMPWYLRALEVSRPLHFGDYGGLPLKILWALLDVVTIAVLGSGLYLWLGRRTAPAGRRIQHLSSDPVSDPAAETAESAK